MFKLREVQEPTGELFELGNGETSLMVSGAQGARIIRWIVAGQEVITPVKNLSYSQTYAAALLFPFANRVAGGAFAFDSKHFQLEINDVDHDAALHGLIYNKRFQLKHHELKGDLARLSFSYSYNGGEAGFPFPYDVQIIYELGFNSLRVEMAVTNSGTSKFPFTAGWHPYFYSKNLKAAKLTFDSKSKIEVDEKLITTSLKPHREQIPFVTDSATLDNGYELHQDPIIFETDEYQLEMTSSSPAKFLQFYTPPSPGSIAIEPTTGVSNSLNNKIGLQVLEPGESHEIEWKIKATIN